jgi:hypothetical protein
MVFEWTALRGLILSVAFLPPARSLSSAANPWLVAVLAVASFVIVLRVGLLPNNPGDGVAVIYAPWTSADQTMLRAVAAGARFVRFGGFHFIAVVMPERSDYVERALAGSALLAVDPQVVGGCFPAALAKAGLL